MVKPAAFAATGVPTRRVEHEVVVTVSGRLPARCPDHRGAG